MFKIIIVSAGLLTSSGASHAISCDALKLEVEQKIRLGGVQNFSLVVVNAAEVAGQVVGTCDNGSKRIVYSARALPPRSAPGDMLTECKPGFTGANCERRVVPGVSSGTSANPGPAPSASR